MKQCLSFLVIFYLVQPLQASVRLPGVLSSNMVLQQKSATKLWGWASPNEQIKITTSWNSSTTTTVAKADSTWQIEVKTPQAGGPYTIIFQGKNKIVLENVLIGEVWICSGQSNMEWNYNLGVSSIKEEFSKLSNLNIRFLNVPKATSKVPRANCGASWTMCDSNTIKAFSAVGYYFGKKISQGTNVPVGLIHSNWGGTPAEVWTPAKLIENNPVLKEAATKNLPNEWWPVSPGATYNAMIAPLLNYNIAGVIWYQGESNRMAPASYAQLMDTMIAAWRKGWNKELPFYYVQIAPYKYEKPVIGALVREAQAKNLSIKKTGMVVVSDLVNDTLNIHPVNKKDVGLRLADLALVETYKIKKEGYKSPVFRSLVIKGQYAVVNFAHAENGLMVKGTAAKEAFIAGADRKFYPAVVEIKNNSILFSNKAVKNPVAVRYQFSNSGIGNLCSKAGLPVAPFRTDGWSSDL